MTELVRGNRLIFTFYNKDGAVIKIIPMPYENIPTTDGYGEIVNKTIKENSTKDTTDCIVTVGWYANRI